MVAIKRGETNVRSLDIGQFISASTLKKTPSVCSLVSRSRTYTLVCGHFLPNLAGLLSNSSDPFSPQLAFAFLFVTFFFPKASFLSCCVESNCTAHFGRVTSFRYRPVCFFVVTWSSHRQSGALSVWPVSQGSHSATSGLS